MGARLLLLALCVLATSCTGMRYLAQAAGGQLEIMARKRPLEEAIHDPSVPAETRALLAEIGPIKAFGERHGLKATESYRHYADLRRPAVVWVVSACDKLSFTPKKWSFPIVGSVPYLGWFDKDDALHHAADLRDDGWDVDVRPASAYSTLGWFDDPVLSTMIDPGPEALGELANVVLHESTHATQYVSNQTAFDEGIASFVAHRLTLVYLDETRGSESAAKRAYVAYEGEGERRRALMLGGYRQLSALYASSLSDTEKLVRKDAVLARLRTEVRSKRAMNNATLFELASYHGSEDALGRLLAACGSVDRFIAALRTVEAADFDEPQQRNLDPVIDRVIPRACPTR